MLGVAGDPGELQLHVGGEHARRRQRLGQRQTQARGDHQANPGGQNTAVARVKWQPDAAAQVLNVFEVVAKHIEGKFLASKGHVQSPQGTAVRRYQRLLCEDYNGVSIYPNATATNAYDTGGFCPFWAAALPRKIQLNSRQVVRSREKLSQYNRFRLWNRLVSGHKAGARWHGILPISLIYSWCIFAARTCGKPNSRGIDLTAAHSSAVAA